MTMIDDLFREAGEELDRLSIDWLGDHSERQRAPRRRRRPRRWVGIAAAGLAAASVTGLVVMDRQETGGVNLAGPTTTVVTAVAPEDLPYEVLASVPAGFELEMGYHGAFGKDFEPPVVLLGWQGNDPDSPMAYVSIERTSPAMNAPPDADEVADGDLTGWVGRFGDLTNAQFDVASRPLRVHAFTPDIPVADLTALADATTGDGLEIEFTDGEPPPPFVELTRQHRDAIGNTGTYFGPGGATIGYGVATDIPLDHYPSDSAVNVSRVSVGGVPGLVIEYTVEGQVDDQLTSWVDRQLIWQGPDGLWRMLSSSSPEGPIPVTQMVALAASRRPATPDEIALFSDNGFDDDSTVSTSEPVASDSLPFEVLDPPDGYESEQSARTDVTGFEPPALLLGWERGSELVPIQVARADLLATLFPDGPMDPRDVESNGASGTIADDGMGVVAEIEVDGVPIYLAAASDAVTDELLIAIAASIDPNPERIEWTDGAPPIGVVELARQEAPAVIHQTSYRNDDRMIAVATLSAMPAVGMAITSHTQVQIVDVNGHTGFEFVQSARRRLPVCVSDSVRTARIRLHKSQRWVQDAENSSNSPVVASKRASIVHAGSSSVTNSVQVAWKSMTRRRSTSEAANR